MPRGDGRSGDGDGVSVKGSMSMVVPPPVYGSKVGGRLGLFGAISGGDYGRRRRIQ